MAIVTMGSGILSDKLGIVGVLMTSVTIFRCALKARGIVCGGFMAFPAGDGTVGAEEWKLGFGVLTRGFN